RLACRARHREAIYNYRQYLLVDRSIHEPFVPVRLKGDRLPVNRRITRGARHQYLINFAPAWSWGYRQFAAPAWSWGYHQSAAPAWSWGYRQFAAPAWSWECRVIWPRHTFWLQQVKWNPAPIAKF